MSRSALTVRAAALQGLGALGLLLLAVPGSAKADSPIVRVEEDWTLLVGEPDPGREAPQITCVISPQSTSDGLFAAFTLNHQNAPDYQAGGLQVHVWRGDTPLAAAQFSNGSLLATPREIISWTQSMSIEGGVLTFQVTRGNSTTWGNFGDGSLRVSVPSSLANLSGYRPATSAANSGVGFAGNRVNSLTLAKIRYCSADGQIYEDRTPRVIHAYRDTDPPDETQGAPAEGETP
jgi:hypothetical protein